MGLFSGSHSGSHSRSHSRSNSGAHHRSRQESNPNSYSRSNSYDRVSRNSDGKKFYGYDEGDGKTAWYNENNELDSITDTPSKDEQDAMDEGWL